MDTSEYMPMFLAEAQEHLQELNLAIVRLEADPRDRETIDEIFRIAHSLKGMSATMGFSLIAKLTHEMEDVFELLRQRSEGLPVEAIDTVLACLDALSSAFDGIAANGEESLDPVPLIDRLHGLVRARTAEQELERAGGAALPDLVSATAAAEPVLHVVAVLSENVLMPAVRAHMVFAALSEHGEVIGGIPEDVEQFAGRRVEAWVTSGHEEEAIAKTVGFVSDVVAVEIAEVDPAAAAPQPDVSEPAVPEPALEPVPLPQAPTPVDAPAVVIATSAPEAAAEQPAVAEPPKAAPAKSSQTRTVRVDAERLDALMHSMGELVIHRTAVEALAAGIDVPGLQQAMQELTRSSQALQSMVMQVRMIPVDVVFLRFPRLIRDLSAQLGKEVKLNLVGSETELDRTVVDALGDPLVHLVRNSLDHGLEPADERVDHGKPEVGTLEISARHAGGSVVIEVRDDGRGINPEAVARKALASGLIDAQAAAEITMKSAIELLFAPGFSTAETTSDISGRGVGMDAVRAKIRELGGEVLLDSTEGQGTIAQIRLPLTLAIVSALQVDVAGAPYAIPLDRVQRTLRLSEQTVRSVAGRRMLVLDDGVLQLLDGAETFGRRPLGEDPFVVIVRAEEQRLAMTVDDLIGQRELVTRPLPPVVSSGEPVSGGAALADGRIALIVDCDALGALCKGAGRGGTRPRGTPRPRQWPHEPTSNPWRTREFAPFSDVQLDALRELANIASGTAATALSQMLSREVEISVPRALALAPADAAEACGPPEQAVAGVVVPILGDISGAVLLLIPHEHADALCRLVGVEARTEVGDSALREIGNILATSYLNGLGAMTGLAMEPSPPELQCDMLGAIVSTLLIGTSANAELALVLDSELDVSGEPCSMSFLLLPTSGQISDLLAPLGLAESTT